MTDIHDMWQLSGAAAQRKGAMLPGLLGAVRARRRRRHVVRAAGVLVVLVAAVLVLQSSPWWRRASGGGAAPTNGVSAHDVAQSTWTTVRDDPTLLERCLVLTVRRAEWFVDDVELGQLLRQARRPAGFVRLADRVQVNPAAIDRWPDAGPEP